MEDEELVTIVTVSNENSNVLPTALFLIILGITVFAVLYSIHIIYKISRRD